MKLTVKTLKGSHFDIRVQPNDSVMAVKKNIEDVQGKDNYPCGQQLLIHDGKVLKDETTLAENAVSEGSFIVVMLSKSKAAGSAGTSSTQPASETPSLAPAAGKTTTSEAPVQPPVSKNTASASASATATATANVNTDIYGQAASNVVGDNNLEQTIQQLMDMGAGQWDRETVTRALRAAYNNPERAVDYLYSSIPETVEVAAPVSANAGAAPAAASSGAPNSSPLNMFPQGTLSGAAVAGEDVDSLSFLRNNEQFQTLRSLVQANPEILEPMLQELGKQNPELLRLVQEHHTEFVRLLNEQVEGSEEDMLDQAEQEMPHAVNVTPAEQQAIERLEAMGFDRDRVLVAFLACDRNEELAANYLLEHAGDFDD